MTKTQRAFIRIYSVIFLYAGYPAHHCVFPKNKTFQSCSSINNSVIALLLVFHTALRKGVTSKSKALHRKHRRNTEIKDTFALSVAEQAQNNARKSPWASPSTRQFCCLE